MKKKRRKNWTTPGAKKERNSIASKLTVHKLDWLEWLSIALCIWFWFYPYPYKLAFTVVLALPVIGLILNGLSNPSLASLVSISNKDGEDKYDLADFIEFPGLVIVVRVLIDFEFESFFSILKVGTISFIIFLLLLGATHRRIVQTDKNKWLIYATVIGNIALYSYAGTYGINCVFDDSEAKTYQARVVDKSISGRKRKTHYLKVEPWGNHYDAENISVARSQYQVTNIGDTVSIGYKKGLLGIPWYYLK